ncbi:USP domain-containing protein [Entamoeba marina]
MLFDCLEDEMTKRNQKIVFPIFTLCLASLTDSIDESVKVHREFNEEFRLVPLPIQGKKTVNACLDVLFKAEVFKGDNKLKTDDGKYFSAVKKYQIASLPPYLLIQLNRFDSFDVNVVKLNDEILVPSQLNLEKFVMQGGLNAEYTLSGVVVHLGNAQSGHYFSYVLVDNVWVEFNDNRVSYASTDIALRNIKGGYKDFCGYLLVYKKNEYEKIDLGNDVNEDIARELIMEEKKISDDVMYHDNHCIRFIMKYIKSFPDVVSHRFVLYCFKYAFSMLEQGEHSLNFVDQIVQLLSNYSDVQLGQTILVDIINSDIILNLCLIASEVIRIRASRLIIMAIKWVSPNDNIELFEETRILQQFYKHIHSKLLISRNYAKNLKQYFSLFEALACIGPKACYKLNTYGLIHSFWNYFKNVDDEGKTVGTLVREVYPDLTSYVAAFQKVICSSKQGEYLDSNSPYSNSNDIRLLGNGLENQLDLFLSDYMMQLIMYNTRVSGRMLCHLLYNNYETSINICGQFKKKIIPNVAITIKEDEFVNLLGVAREILLIKDDYTDLRMLCMFSPFSSKSCSLNSPPLDKNLTNGLLQPMKDHHVYNRHIISFVLSLEPELLSLRELLFDNCNTLEMLANVLINYLKGNYTEIKLLLSRCDSGQVGIISTILSMENAPFINEVEFANLKRIQQLIEERDNQQPNIELVTQQLFNARREYEELRSYEPNNRIIQNYEEPTYGPKNLFSGQ